MEIIDKLYFIVAVVVIAICVRCPNEAYNVSRGVDHESSSRPIVNNEFAQPAAKKFTQPVAKNRIAVLDFRSAKTDIEEQELLLLTDYARETVFKSGAFDVVTEENAEIILASYGRELEDCAASCEIEFGAMLGADYVLTGRLANSGDYTFVSMSIHGTENAHLVAKISYRSKNFIETRSLLEVHVFKLIKQIDEIYYEAI